MTTAVQKFETNFPALKMGADDVSAAMRENLKGQKLNAFDLTNIKVPSGGATSFEVPTLEGNKPVQDLKVVILKYQDVRRFYQKDFDDADAESGPPDCACDDLLEGVGKGDPGGDCAACEFNEWESDPKGGKGKACKEYRTLYCITEYSVLPVVITVPPTSLKSAKQYGLDLAGAGKRISTVGTTITLKTQGEGKVKWSVMEFAYAGTLSDEEATAIATYRDSIEAITA